MGSALSGAGVRSQLQAAFGWYSKSDDGPDYAEVTQWWRRGELLAALGPALAELFVDDRPTVVLGVQSRGCLLGPLTATALGVGFIEVRKWYGTRAAADGWLTCTTPPDYKDRHLILGIRGGLLQPADRALLVDDWIATGGQAQGVQRLVEASPASWTGVAVIVDALADNRTRRDLNVRRILHLRDL